MGLSSVERCIAEVWDPTQARVIFSPLAPAQVFLAQLPCLSQSLLSWQELGRSPVPVPVRARPRPRAYMYVISGIGLPKQ